MDRGRRLSHFCGGLFCIRACAIPTRDLDHHGRLRFVLRSDAARAESPGSRNRRARGPGTRAGSLLLCDQCRHACCQPGYGAIVEALRRGRPLLRLRGIGRVFGAAACDHAGCGVPHNPDSNLLEITAIQVLICYPCSSQAECRSVDVGSFRVNCANVTTALAGRHATIEIPRNSSSHHREQTQAKPQAKRRPGARYLWVAGLSCVAFAGVATLTSCGNSAKATTPPPPSAPTVKITANPGTVPTGTPSMLTVTASNATQVVISDNIDSTTFTLTGNGGAKSVTPTTTTTYTATATGAGGTATAQV